METKEGCLTQTGRMRRALHSGKGRTVNTGIKTRNGREGPRAKAWWGTQPTVKLKSDHKRSAHGKQRGSDLILETGSFSIRSDIKISWET